MTFTGSVYLGILASKSGKNRNDGDQSSEPLELPDKPTRLQTWNSLASSYDDKIGWDETVMGLPLLRRWLVSSATGSVLEVAVGTGRNLKYYQTNRSQTPVSSITVTDTSQKMLEVAQARAATTMLPETKPLEVVHSEVETLACHPDLSGRRFDTIVDTFGLCSFEDPVQALVQMQQICKPSGKVLLLEHGRSAYWDWLSQLLDKNAVQHATKWGCIWNRDIAGIVARSGLEVESMTTYHFGTTYLIIGKPGKNSSTCTEVSREKSATLAALSPVKENTKNKDRVCSCQRARCAMEK